MRLVRRLLLLLVALFTMAARLWAAPGPSIQLVRAYLANEKGARQADFHPTDAGVYVYLYFHNLRPRAAQRHVLRLQAVGPDGRAYGRRLGGAFTVARGQSLDGRDFPRTIDADHHNGWLIRGEVLARLPGAYDVRVTLDGRPIARIPFRLLPGASGMKFVRAYLADGRGRETTRFEPSDGAVYVYAFFRNLDRKLQTHRFTATFYAPGGARFGRVLGGMFRIQAGQDISRVDLPRSVDLAQHNGFLLANGKVDCPPGTYRVLLRLDGRVVKELRYTVASGAAPEPSQRGAPGRKG